MRPKFREGLALIALVTLALPCVAQQQQPKANKYRNRDKGTQVLQQNSAKAVYTRMQQPPDLPNLPNFTSGKFMYARSGEVGRNNQKSVHLEYAINEPPPSVIAWYEMVLKQYGWKMGPKTDNSLYAMRPKDGNVVNVFVDNMNLVGYRYRLNIAYKFCQPQEDDGSASRNVNSNLNRSGTTQTR
ncbi:MAG: hypothetical protein U0105_07200 [Candidatus Obscuribacterales bacterium]